MTDSTKKDIAISVRDIRKEFILPQSKNSSFKQSFVNIVKKNNKVTQKVLDGVSFDVHKGDFFGIVGRNGSGKSTLLKMLAGVYTPTAGEIQVNGGLTPFIELGVGFNPELSGRDNVYLNGALLGFNRNQMDEMYYEIVSFAELEPFMDQKLKNYSSGMQVRLAFSIAIMAKNEVLIFDEVLAVGDEAFQRKCLDVFERYKAEGQTVILVTHDMEQVRRFCTRAILISDGKLIKDGDPREIADLYSKLNLEQISKESGRSLDGDQQDSDFVTELTAEGDLFNLTSGANLKLNLKWNASMKADKIVVNLFKNTGEYIVGLAIPRERLLSGEVTLSLSPRLGMGKHLFTIEAYGKESGLIGGIHHAAEFTIGNTDIDGIGGWSGLLALDHNWS